MKKKLALLLAVVHRPRLLVLDEPTSGLDVEAVQSFCELVRELAASGTTVLFSTHQMDHVAWLCAEDVHAYKPDPEFWREMGRRTGTGLDRRWWHVSAYADYDLDVAGGLGLTTVLVRRPHCRPGPATHVVDDLIGLARLVG